MERLCGSERETDVEIVRVAEINSSRRDKLTVWRDFDLLH